MDFRSIVGNVSVEAKPPMHCVHCTGLRNGKGGGIREGCSKKLTA